MRRHYDRVKPDGVLNQPQVNEHGRSGVGTHEVVHLIVNVEQRHRAQHQHRHAHRGAVHVGQRGIRVPDRPVSDPDYFHDVGGRRRVPAAVAGPVKIPAVRDSAIRRGRRSGGHRVDRRELLAEYRQVTVDVAEFVFQAKAQRHEVGLGQERADVLRVHEHEKHHDDRRGVLHVQYDQP